jgi:molybdate transport system substrate-binding protein
MLTTVVTLLATAANAADIKVISAGAVRALIAGMIDDYSKQTGHKFDFTTGPTGFLRNVIATGQHADLIIASAPLMGELEKTGKLTPGSRNDLGRVGMAVVIREGAPVPDVSTPEALKQLLLKASSIAYTDPKLGGTTVIHLMKLADRFGITEAVVKKGVLATGGDDASEKVAHGQAEIAVSLISEIVPIKGAKMAVTPGDTQLWIIYASADPDEQQRASVCAPLSRRYITAMAPRWSTGGFEESEIGYNEEVTMCRVLQHFSPGPCWRLRP